MNKKDRQKALMEIIASRRLGSQHQLRAELQKQGITAAQSSISRDLIELRVTKTGGAYQLPVRSPGEIKVGKILDLDTAELTEIIGQSRRAFGRLAQGAVSRILIEGESSSMIVVPAGDYAALAVMVDADIKLGLAMFQITRVAEQIGGLV